MIALIRKFIGNILTARDNVTFSMTKLIGASGAATACWKFVTSASVDFVGFGAAIAGIIGALAVKHHVEGSQNDPA